MMKSSLLTILVLAAASASAQNFSLEISRSELPETVTAVDADGFEQPSSCYKNAKTTDGWMVSAVGNTRYALVSPSHSHEGRPQDNRLSIKPLLIEPGAFLTWQARSVYSDFPDTYKITAQVEGDSEPTVIFEGTAEDVFTPHAVSLKDFAGKNTVITFICNSEDGYLLAIKDVYAGVPTSPNLTVTDKTVHFNGPSLRINLTGSLYNSGANTKLTEVVIKANGVQRDAIPVETSVATGETFQFSYPLETVLNQKTDYTLEFKTADKSVVATMTGTAISSHFPRTHFVDEGTGTWCNNCPEGTIRLKNLERQYPGQVSVVCTHLGTEIQDPFINPDYAAGLKFYAVPYMMMDRNRSTQGATTQKFDAALWQPTDMAITLRHKSDGVHVSLFSAEDRENTQDRYRLGYVVTGDFYQTETDPQYIQKNILTLPTSEEYYFLPTLIVTHMVKFHNINLLGEGYFDGIANSIPDYITAADENVCSVLNPDVPEDEHLTNPVLHAYILDTETGEIKNCSSIRIDGSQLESLTEMLTPDADPIALKIDAGILTITGTDKADVTFYSIDGRILFRDSKVTNSTRLPAGLTGPVIIRVTAPEGTAMMKAIL